MKYAFRLFLFLYIFACSFWAHAYVGPGAGLSAIGTIIAFVAAVVLMIVGFLWYPIKRLFKGKNASHIQKNTLSESDSRKTDRKNPK
jgi:hypothetical protein